MRIIQTFCALTILSLTTARINPCQQAFLECDWEFRSFEGSIPRFGVNTPPDRPFTPLIVSKDMSETIGILNTNNAIPEFIVPFFGPIPITEFPATPPFTPTHFKPFNIANTMSSGVGHQFFQGDQAKFARRQCVRVFFTMFQLLVGDSPPQVKNINVDRSDFKCVVFRLIH